MRILVTEAAWPDGSVTLMDIEAFVSAQSIVLLRSSRRVLVGGTDDRARKDLSGSRVRLLGQSDC